MNPNDLLDRYIRARYPVIGIVSHEEARVLAAISQVAGSKRQIVEWSCTAGLTGLSGITPDEYQEPGAALDVVAKFDEDGSAKSTVFVFKDLHQIMKVDPRTVRFLRDIAIRFETRRHNLILLSPSLDVPADLEKQVALIDWPLPDIEELGQILRQAELDLPVPITLGENGKREAVVQALRGLTKVEAQNVLKAGVVATRELGESVIPYIVKEKAQIIRKAGVLEYYDTSVTMAEVGGLEYLKEYAEIKREAFTSKARAFGLDAPKGLLMLGVPGSGKSLSAKAIAGGKMPLVRMDVGALMGGLVGQSEANMRLALKTVEAIAPCVLWIDEAEKGLGGMNGGESDGGTTSRVFGTLLTWMQENKAPVYTIATVNEVRGLRPELLRRFNDIMWFDLPNAAARREILTIHIEKRNHNAADILRGDANQVVDAMWGFSGNEIEKVVQNALEKAYFQKREMVLEDLLNAARRIVPVSVTMAEQINNLRAWAANRTIPASQPLEAQPKASKAKDTGIDL
jgi:AAA+ superfamily predicted ATPase